MIITGNKVVVKRQCPGAFKRRCKVHMRIIICDEDNYSS